MKKILTIGIMLLFIVMTISSSTGFDLEKQSIVTALDGNTFYVGGTGPNNYTKIQDAINDSEDGDTVFVFDDSSPYYENVQINNSINLIGEDKDTTVIYAKRKGHVITISSNNVSIHEFTIQNSSGNFKAGIKIDFYFGFCTISDNIIIDNDNGVSMFLSGDNNIIEDNTFFNNRWTIYGTNNNNTISGNNIDHPPGTYPSNGIGFDGGIGNNISGNTIKNCDSGVSLSNDADYNIVLKNVISSGEYDGIRISEGSNNKIIGNNISYNLYWGIEIQKGNDNVIYHNNLEYNYRNAMDQGNNIWDDGEYGNYWSDYKQKYPDAKKLRKEGIWDTPYEIPSEPRGDNYDTCPLIEQWPDPFSKSVHNNENIWFHRLLDRFPILQIILETLNDFYDNMNGGIWN